MVDILGFVIAAGVASLDCHRMHDGDGLGCLTLFLVARRAGLT